MLVVKHGVGERFYIGPEERVSLALEANTSKPVPVCGDVTHGATDRGEPEILVAVAPGDLP